MKTRSAIVGVALLLGGCVQGQQTGTAQQAAPAPVVQEVRLSGLEKAVQMKGLHKIEVALVNVDAPSCQVAAVFDWVTLRTAKRATCDEAIGELGAKIQKVFKAPEEAPVAGEVKAP